MTHGCLYRTELREAMLQRRPRLAVILSDCCSTGAGAADLPPAADKAIPEIVMHRPRGSGSTARDLLFRHHGLVVVSAAHAGHAASGTSAKGNNFTRAFCALLLDSPRRYD